MQPFHIAQDTSIHPTNTTHPAQTTDVPAADDLAALWLDLGGSD